MIDMSIDLMAYIDINIDIINIGIDLIYAILIFFITYI